jgi:hypothetical protein
MLDIWGIACAKILLSKICCRFKLGTRLQTMNNVFMGKVTNGILSPLYHGNTDARHRRVVCPRALVSNEITSSGTESIRSLHCSWLENCLLVAPPLPMNCTQDSVCLRSVRWPTSLLCAINSWKSSTHTHTIVKHIWVACLNTRSSVRAKVNVPNSVGSHCGMLVAN